MKHKTELSAGGIVYKKLDSSIVNRESDVVWLITQHSQHKGWGFPKGLVGDVHTNETLQEAALREVREEGGVVAQIVNNTPVETAYKYQTEEFLVDKKVNYFLMEYVSGEIKDHDAEVMDIRFASADEVRNTLTYQTDKEAFEKLFKLFNG